MTLNLPNGVSPRSALDAAYRALLLNPYSADTTVAVFFADLGYDGQFISEVIAAHKMKRYEAETGHPF